MKRLNRLTLNSSMRNLIRIESSLLTVLAFSMAIPLLIALYDHEAAPAKAFAGVIGFCLIISMVSRMAVSPSNQKIKGRDGFLIVSTSWLVASLIGAMPLYFSGAIPNYIDALFESCSGFSTTGASILTDIEALPRAILFWRSFTHWLGGMGILVFVIALLPTLGISGQLVANAETPGPTKDKITAKFSDTAKDLYLIYIAMTIVEVVLLLLGGLSLYDSLLHTFGTVGTGGFSCYNDSIAHFDSLYVEWVIITFMALAGMNFNLFYIAGKRGVRTIFRDEEARFYLWVICIVSALIFVCLLLQSGDASSARIAGETGDSIGKTLTDTVFQVVSILTTTGYITADYDLWPTFARMLLLTLFFLGGCSSSTGGGIKCVRIQIAAKLVKRGISIKLHPNRIATVTFNEKELSNDVVINITNFIFTYLLVMAGGALLLTATGLDFLSGFTAAATCLGNIGPGFGAVGPTMNFAGLLWPAKLTCSLLMICGRLELFTVLVLFSRHYWNANKS